MTDLKEIVINALKANQCNPFEVGHCVIADEYEEVANDIVEALSLPSVSGCSNYDIQEKAWNLYCKEAGMCGGAVDYWEQVNKETQDVYICKIVRGE